MVPVEVRQEDMEAGVRALRLKQMHAKVPNAGTGVEDEPLTASSLITELQFDAWSVAAKT